jgi:hypothetical protein
MEFYLTFLLTVIAILSFSLASQRNRIRRKLLCAALRIRLNVQVNCGLAHFVDSFLLLRARFAFFCRSLHTFLQTALLPQSCALRQSALLHLGRTPDNVAVLV